MSTIRATAEDAARDQLLAELFEHLTEQRRQGLQPDVDRIARQHPELADELRGLWAVSQLAGEFADPSKDRPTISPGRTPPSTAILPRRFGNYELLEEIGRGGMGVVYKARQCAPDRLVAIKMVLRAGTASTAEMQRFQSEAQSAARLDGIPNIVSVHEVGEVEGQPFFSMEFIEGTTLARLSAEKLLAPRHAARVLATVADAVHQAHQQGILHRDLKPSNILVDRQGQPHVADFGLAKRVEGDPQLTQSGAIVGTPSYMPPEQAAGSRGRLGPASDVYSLGAILYELLTGQPPFQAATPVDTLLSVLDRDVVPPRLLNRKIDVDLENICLKCLQKPVDLRYPSAGELASDLRAYVNGERISARPSGLAQVVDLLFRETHHAAVLENWGLLWMWHSLKIQVISAVTIGMYVMGVTAHWPYLVLWAIGLLVWGQIFWMLRQRGGPVTFIERQIAHVWATGILGCVSIFVAEWVHGMPVLSMAPGLAVIGSMVFLVKAGMLSGSFYLASGALLVTSMVMACNTSHPVLMLCLFSLVSGACFFFPGLRYYRQRARSFPPAQ